MKLIYTLLLLVSTIGLINSQFVNFLPHNTQSGSSSTCSGKPYGVGFSIALNKCIFNIGQSLGGSLDSWLITSVNNTSGSNSDSNEETIKVTQYVNNDSCDENESTSVLVSTFQNNECLNTTPNFKIINGSLNGMNPIQNSKIVLSSQSPIYSTNSIVYNQYPINVNGNCVNENLLYSITYSNGLTITDSSNSSYTSTYVCSKNRPGFETCVDNENCKTIRIAQNCNSNTNGDQIIFCQN